MATDGPHHIINDSATGKSQERRLLTPDELAFHVRMALMKCPAFSGTPKMQRPHIKAMIEQSVVESFGMSSYQVFGVLARADQCRITDLGGKRIVRIRGIPMGWIGAQTASFLPTSPTRYLRHREPRQLIVRFVRDWEDRWRRPNGEKAMTIQHIGAHERSKRANSP